MSNPKDIDNDPLKKQLTEEKTVYDNSKSLSMEGRKRNLSAIRMFNQSLIADIDYSLKSVIWQITKLCFPTALFVLGINLQITLSLIFIGQKYDDPDMRDAIGISVLFINILLISIVIGLNTGFELLGSNAHGKKDYRLLGIYMHRSKIVTFMICTVLAIIVFVFIGDVCDLMEMNDNYKKYTIRFARVFIFVYIPEVQFRVNSTYLNIVDLAFVNTIIVLGTFLFHILDCYIFINWLELDTLGAGLSILISQLLNAIISTLYIEYKKPIPESIFWINKQCFYSLWDYLKIALPSTVLLATEWWAFEFLSIFAIMLGQRSYDAHVILFNMFMALCGSVFGFTTASTILVSNALGQGNSKQAKRVFIITFIYGVSFQVILALGLFIFKNFFIGLYTDDKELIDKASKVVNIIGIMIIFDMSQFFLNSYCKSCTKLCVTTIICVVNFYCIQLSLAYVFSHVLEWDVFGIWFAILMNEIILIICYLIYVATFNYDEIVKAVQAKLQEDNDALDNYDRKSTMLH